MEQKVAITQEVIALLVELTGYEGTITSETRLGNELGLDSLDRADLSYHVEDEFKVKMRAHWQSWRTVSDVADTIIKLREEKELLPDYLFD